MKNESKEFSYILMERIGRPTHVVEVGAYESEHLTCLPFVYDPKCRKQLIEPNPRCIKELQQAFTGFSNLEIYSCAVADQDGQINLMIPERDDENTCAEASAFASDIPLSPYKARRAHGPTEEVAPLVVPAVTFDKFDNGTIDGLVVDIEGSEWFVIKHLRSRPAVICIEMEGPCGYKNPYFENISSWMDSESYQLISIEKVSRQEGLVPTDYIYVRNGD